MTEQQAKELVVAAGLRLVESGLIARTWGNVSCRISDTQFVITPSGRDYLSLAAADIVPMSIDDLSYTGHIKPSGERGIHAEIYRYHPEVQFVIHTHQEYASVLSAADVAQFAPGPNYPLLGGSVVCAAYGLPGTKTLRRSIRTALQTTGGGAIIMKHHGAVCFGKTEEEAFSAASDLELACKDYIMARYLQQKQLPQADDNQLRRCALTMLAKPHSGKSNYFAPPYCNSERTADGFLLQVGDKQLKVAPGRLPAGLPPEAALHDAIYKANPDIQHILHSDTPDAVAVSQANLTLRPLLDDFAQIVGTQVKTVFGPPAKVAGALKHASAVLLGNHGALCCGATAGDAAAVKMIVEKNCKALLRGTLLGKVTPISKVDSLLMRVVYLKKYSKQISANKG